MNIEELFAGIGVVIDDQVYNKDANSDRIVTIVKQLEEEKHFPLVKYADFPSAEKLRKMGNVSFLLLDWEIDNRENVLGDNGLKVNMPDSLKQSNKQEVIKIVQTFLQNNLAPVFIFSNQDTSTIKKDLKKAKIDLTKSPVFVESKSNLVGEGELFKKIGDWVNAVSGVYVAKVWENAFNRAKNQFFAEMATNTSHWPKSLFQTAVDDTVSPGEEITHAVSRNIISRMFPITIDHEQIGKDHNTPSKEEVRGIMKGQYFLEPASESSMVGDFYHVKKHDKFYVNIRPSCDCVNRESNSGEVYLLRCDKMGKEQLRKSFVDGHFSENIGCAIVGPIYRGNFYRIIFKELCIVPAQEWSEKKVGRILPPVINHVAERYGLYIQRQALPRLPLELLPELNPDGNSDEKKGCLASLVGMGATNKCRVPK